VDGLNPSFSLAVPERWYVRDADTREWESSTASQMDERLACRPDLLAAASTLRRVVMDSWKDAESQGALAAATLWEPSDDGRGATAATLVVAAERARPDDGAAEIAGLVAALGEPSESDLAPRRVSAVELPVGPAVRLRRLTRTTGAGPGEGELVVDTVQHWVPVPGGRTIVVLAGSTPCLDVADELAEAFDAIAATLRFDTHR